MQSIATVSVIPMSRCGIPYVETRFFFFLSPSFHLHVVATAYFKCGQESPQNLPTQGHACMNILNKIINLTCTLKVVNLNLKDHCFKSTQLWNKAEI